jgi:hypothetical protein
MEKENQSVNPESSQDSSDAPDKQEQTPAASEGVNTQEVERLKEINENLKKAIKEEREKRKKDPVKPKEPESEDEEWQEWEEVKTTVAMVKLQEQDPTFNDRKDLVIDEMKRTGKSLEDANNSVLASLIRYSMSTPEQAPKSPNTIRPSATPEPQQDSRSSYERIKQGDFQNEDERILAKLWSR